MVNEHVIMIFVSLNKHSNHTGKNCVRGLISILDKNGVCGLESIRVVCKVLQRKIKPWVWSFFEKTFYIEPISSSYIGAYFEPPLPTSQTPKRNLGSKIGYVHGTCQPQSQNWPLQDQLGPPILVRQTIKLDFNNPTPLLCKVIQAMRGFDAFLLILLNL